MIKLNKPFDYFQIGFLLGIVVGMLLAIIITLFTITSNSGFSANKFIETFTMASL